MIRRYTRAPLLKFDSHQKDLTESLSAALFVGEHLWLASDELTSVERLSTTDGLTFDGHECEDLLVLAGPSMNLDGPVGLYRWVGALSAANESLVRSDKLPRLLEIPHGDGEDHAEGLTFVPGVEQPRQILVVYDSPGAHRREGEDAVRADVFDVPAAT
jgi:Protein of unknown function (DUF3616)